MVVYRYVLQSIHDENLSHINLYSKILIYDVNGRKILKYDVDIMGIAVYFMQYYTTMDFFNQ